METRKHILFFLIVCLIFTGFGLFFFQNNIPGILGYNDNNGTNGQNHTGKMSVPVEKDVTQKKVTSNLSDNIVFSQKVALEQLTVNTSQNIVERNYVSIDTAKKSALLTLAQLLYLDNLGVGVIQPDNVQLYPEPTVIFDANGKMLFYEFYAGTPERKTIVIDIAASKILGTPVIRAGEAAKNPVNLESITKRAQEIIDSEYPGYSIEKANFVCYAYPLTGLEIILQDKKSHDEKRIFVTAWGMENDRYLQSYQDRIPSDEYRKRISEWDLKNLDDIKIISKINNAGINLSDPYSAIDAEKIRTLLQTGNAVE
jgi:hypothetical protein